MNETQNKKPESKGVKVLKTIINTIINILIVVVLIASLLIAVMALTSKAHGVSTIFGTTIQTIESDSMKGGSPDGYEGGDFEHGDLMLAKAADEDSVYDLGDIVTFRSTDSTGTEMLIVHRIVDAVERDDGTYVYQTWGDNREMSQAPDQQNVEDYLRSYDIVSVYYSADYQGKIIKGVGSALDYLRTQQGFFFVVLLPMIIFFMYALIRVVLTATGYKKTKAEEMKQEAVDAAVAAALAERDAQKEFDNSAPEHEKPEQLTEEEMEQFRQFREFQKMQKARSEEPPKED